jgi:hypothetical protein
MSETAKAAPAEGYEVGFGKPPVHTRFQPGQSGNPAGRPKGARNLASVLEQELNAPVSINENGQRKTVTKLEAAIKQLVKMSLSGDMRALQQLLALYRMSQSTEGEEAPEPLTRDSDAKVLQGILKRMQRDAGGNEA